MSDQGGRILPPGAPQASQTPNYQASHAQVPFESFEGIDTKSPRPAVQDKMMAWCSGFMPIGPSQLAIIPDVGPTVFSSGPGSGAGGPGGETIVWFGFGNISTTYYALILLSNGAVWACNTDTGAAVQVMAPGTIQVPRTQMGFNQWGSQYLLFAKDQTNGYWIWDGTLLYYAGTIGPIVTVNDGGSNYTSPPTVTLQTTDPSGDANGATFSAQLEPGTGSVDQITVTNPGSGLSFNDFAILNFSGGGSDTNATFTANIGPGGGITGIYMTNGGQAYTYAAIAVATGGGGSGAVLAPNVQGGVMIGVTIVNPGINYTSPPDIDISDPGGGGVSGGHGAVAYATIGLAGINSITIDDPGTDYTSVPTLNIIGDGQNASANAVITNGQVTAVNITNPGYGYTKALVQAQGGNNAASASPIIMPFGWSGTSIEVYQDRVWISNGAAQATWPPQSRLIWSAPENPCDPGNGGGALLGSDSFLRVGWFTLKQTNGFLYLIGDSSVNNVSGVNTAVQGQTAATATSPGTPGVLTTTFDNQNTDPQIGSSWPSSVQLFNRNILFANPQGIHVSYGGAVQKVSAPLDGVFFGDPSAINNRSADFPSAVAQVFGIQVYCLLVPITDPTTGQISTQLIMYDSRKFWTSTQGVTLTYIEGQEIQSSMTAWGTDGTNLFRLFQNPSINFTKTVQSKLWAVPGYDWTKTAVRLYGIISNFSNDADVEVSIDNETGSNPFIVTLSGGSGQNEVFGPYPVGQIGKMMGFTIETAASSGDLLSILARLQDFMLNN